MRIILPGNNKLHIYLRSPDRMSTAQQKVSGAISAGDPRLFISTGKSVGIVNAFSELV